MKNIYTRHRTFPVCVMLLSCTLLSICQSLSILNKIISQNRFILAKFRVRLRQCAFLFDRYSSLGRLCPAISRQLAAKGTTPGEAEVRT